MHGQFFTNVMKLQKQVVLKLKTLPGASSQHIFTT